jgi:DNA primase large subunit
MAKTKDQLIEKITDLTRPSKYVRDYRAPKEVMPDLVLVSPRHLFRMPYSLHEKTALASVVLNPQEIKDFDLKDADPLKVKIRNFIPEVKEGEASELLMQALDWHKEHYIQEKEETIQEYKPIKISNLSDDFFPPCIQNILKGLRDGRQRSVFILMNLFRSLGMDKEEVEKRIYDWNEKNQPPLKKGIIKSQLFANYRRKKPLMPPNCKEYYQNIGLCSPNEICKLIKNPVNYVIRKNFILNNKKSNKFKKKN